MPQFSKTLKLGTLLNAINTQEFVLITYNHGRSTWSGPAGQAETVFAKDLGMPIIALTAQGGTIKAFI